MAENTSQRSIWVTLGAALGTVVVILGIAAGPTAISCMSDQAGFAGCVRSRLADFGLLKSSPAEIEQSASLTTSSEGEADPSSATPATPQAETATAEPVHALSLGLVRAEPSGDLVIAGSATPGDVVSIFANGELLGTTIAEASGDWVFVPDAPLATGGAEITVGVPATGEVAASSVVVVIQDDRKTEPLVVASAPGEASKILQGLKAPEAVAVADTPAAAPEATPEVAETSEPAPVEPAAETTTNAPSEPIVVAEETPETVQPAEPAVAEPAPAEPAPAEPTVAIETTEPAVAPETAVVAEAEPVAVPEVSVAEPAVTPEPAAAPEVAVISAPSIDAIEVDGVRNFFAGGGTDGVTVRLYVDDQYIADTVVDNGRWLVETMENHLTKKSQRVRVDALRDGTAEVVARAEVDFEIDLPEIAEPANPVVVAETADPVEQINAAANDTAGAALATAPVIGDVASAADATQTDVVASTEEAESTDASQPAEPVVEPAPVVEPEPVAEPEPEAVVPTMVAVAVGDDEAHRFASGKAIIRRGDNLWTIAGRVYGSGYRYTTIYQANRKQIQNPNLIYPGQVFDLPSE